jgi:hypothetical protein
MEVGERTHLVDIVAQMYNTNGRHTVSVGDGRMSMPPAASDAVVPVKAAGAAADDSPADAAAAECQC